MKKLLIFTLTIFGLNTVVSQTTKNVQKNYLIADTSQVLLSSAEKNEASNFNSVSTNINPVLKTTTIENLENNETQNNLPVIAAKEKKRPLLKLFKNHSFFPEQLALKMPHM